MKCLSVALILMLWITLFMSMMVVYPSNSQIKPTVWLFLTALLILLFSIKRFGGDLKNTLSFHQFKPLWGLFSIVLGVFYWTIDFWINNQLFKNIPTESVLAWRQANETYLPITVLISSVILAPFFEELFFRGLLFKAMINHINWMFSAIISAFLFALIHWSWPEFISIFFVGVIYAILTQKSGSIIPAIMAHIVHNLITFVYYTQHHI